MVKYNTPSLCVPQSCFYSETFFLSVALYRHLSHFVRLLFAVTPHSFLTTCATAQNFFYTFFARHLNTKLCQYLLFLGQAYNSIPLSRCGGLLLRPRCLLACRRQLIQLLSRYAAVIQHGATMGADKCRAPNSSTRTKALSCK